MASKAKHRKNEGELARWMGEVGRECDPEVTTCMKTQKKDHFLETKICLSWLEFYVGMEGRGSGEWLESWKSK